MKQAPPILPYSHHAEPPTFARILMRPVGWIYFSFLGICALWLLWRIRIPDSFSAHVFMVIGGTIFLSIAGLRLILHAVLIRIYRKPWSPFWSGTIRTAIVVAIGVIFIALRGFEVVPWIAFKFSESAMRAEAQAILLREPPSGEAISYYPGKTLGILPMGEISFDRSRKSVTFLVQDSGLFGRSGWTFSPSHKLTEKVPYGDPDGPWYKDHEELW
jgi:hypothetical protein